MTPSPACSRGGLGWGEAGTEALRFVKSYPLPASPCNQEEERVALCDEEFFQ
jgi:hypothetical protein